MGIKAPTIQHDAFTMRHLESRDATALHQILANPDVIRFMPFKASSSLEKVQRFVDQHIEHWDKFAYGWWALESIPEKKFIGWCGLEYLPELSQTEVGYLLDTQFWGKGIATQAVASSLRFAFEQVNLPQVIALVHPENAGSIRVLEKNDMLQVAELDLWGMHFIKFQKEKLWQK